MTRLILIVDDDPFIRRLIATTLEDVAGFELAEAADGEEAVETAAATPPAIVFLDIEMPRMNGLAACERLRADPSTASATIVILTAAAGEEAERQATAAGADRFLTKPFSPLDLLRLVDQLGRLRSGIRPIAQPPSGNTDPVLDDRTAGTVALGGDLRVRRLGFGAMRVTGDGIWGEPRDHDAALAVLRRAVELGVNLIDTADSYGPEVSERLIAEALHPYPDDLVIATKGGLLRSGPGQWEPDCRPEHLREACEGSLRRLQLERIPLYQLHTVDHAVPLEESIGALVELREEGKIAHIGISNVSVEQLEHAAELTEVVSVQNRFNLADRESEDVLDACQARGLGFIPWFPLATGDLAREGGPLDEVAARHDATPGQIALAWLLGRSPVMLPIPGTASIGHLEENVAAAAIELDDAEVAELEAAAGS